MKTHRLTYMTGNQRFGGSSPCDWHLRFAACKSREERLELACLAAAWELETRLGEREDVVSVPRGTVKDIVGMLVLQAGAQREERWSDE